MKQPGGAGERLVGWIAAALAGAVVCAWPSAVRAYEDYAGCNACHGDFRASSYTSQADGISWGVNLHDLHRNTMLSGDCDTCHGTGMSLAINTSSGGNGLAAISCMGCHGRAEDNVMTNPDYPSKGGYGAGLRQHHFNAGTTLCLTCHLDSSPDNFTVAGEHVLPPYYASPGMGHGAMPDDPCNTGGNENFAGLATGLDNDGDGVYDGADSDCVAGTPDAGVPDAMPGVPDAMPGVPDAMPGAPDATPGVPDATPGAPDAEPVDGDAGFDEIDAAPVGPDAGPVVRPDAASGGGGGDDDDGCGCRVDEGGAPGAGSLLLMLACAWLLRRRRR